MRIMVTTSHAGQAIANYATRISALSAKLDSF